MLPAELTYAQVISRNCFQSEKSVDQVKSLPNKGIRDLGGY